MSKTSRPTAGFRIALVYTSSIFFLNKLRRHFNRTGHLKPRFRLRPVDVLPTRTFESIGYELQQFVSLVRISERVFWSARVSIAHVEDRRGLNAIFSEGC